MNCITNLITNIPASFINDWLLALFTHIISAYNTLNANLLIYETHLLAVAVVNLKLLFQSTYKANNQSFLKLNWESVETFFNSMKYENVLH